MVDVASFAPTRVAAGLGASLVGGLLLGACAGGPAYVSTDRDGVTVWAVGTAEVSGEAAADGVVRWLPAERCWVLQLDPDPGVDPARARLALVWPRGTTVASTAPAAVQVRGRGTVADGTRLRASSAQFGAAPDGLVIPPDCRTAGVAVLTSIGS